MIEQRAQSRYAGPTTLVDLLDRVVDVGAVVSGDVLISLAGIDLIRLDLRLLLVSAARSHEARSGCS
jgi:hypothetical protein